MYEPEWLIGNVFDQARTDGVVLDWESDPAGEYCPRCTFPWPNCYCHV